MITKSKGTLAYERQFEDYIKVMKVIHELIECKSHGNMYITRDYKGKCPICYPIKQDSWNEDDSNE